MYKFGNKKNWTTFLVLAFLTIVNGFYYGLDRGSAGIIGGDKGFAMIIIRFLTHLLEWQISWPSLILEGLGIPLYGSIWHFCFMLASNLLVIFLVSVLLVKVYDCTKKINSPRLNTK